MAGFQALISPQKASVKGLRFADCARATGGVSRVQAMLFDVIPGAAVWHWFVDNRCMKAFVMGHKVEVC